MGQRSGPKWCSAPYSCYDSSPIEVANAGGLLFGLALGVWRVANHIQISGKDETVLCT